MVSKPVMKLAAALLLVSSCALAQTSRPLSATTRPSYKEFGDVLEMTDSAAGFSYGTLENANVQLKPTPRIELGYRELDYPRTGTWTGPVVSAKFPFTELLPSFNVSTPGQSGVVLEVRVRHDAPDRMGRRRGASTDAEPAGDWSPWLYIQSWGSKLAMPPTRITKYDFGHIDVDTLMLDKPATAYQTRVTLQSFDFDTKNKPALRRLAVVYSGVITDPAERAKYTAPSTQPTNWARDIPVPFRGQGAYDNPRALWSQICSPTSTSMVLEYYGLNYTTPENAVAIWDPVFDLFGNWGRAVSRAGELGLDAHLERFRNWDQVKAVISQGTPIIASIRFRKGEVKGFLYESTKGHLIVIRGMTEDGSFIVNDPARRDKGNHVIYPAEGMATAWLAHGGVGYVISKPSATTRPTLANTKEDDDP